MFNELTYMFKFISVLFTEFLIFLNINLIAFLVVLCFVVFVVIETRTKHFNKNKIIILQSYLTNMATFFFNSSLLSLLSISSLLMLAERYKDNGLFARYDQPIQVLLSFILFDFILYLWHKACHKCDFLWIFHKVHHSDKSMNVSTAFRVHFIEIMLTTLIKVCFILITGIEASIVAMCEAISMLFTMYHHINISCKHEKWIKWLLVVPSQHRTHHSLIRQEHDNNYGAIFSLWDRIFKTLLEKNTLEVGLTNVKVLSFFQLLKFGLTPKTYTSNTDVAGSSQIMAEPQQVINFNTMIAEAAYYKSEKRGFVTGFEFSDWFEAEQEIKNCIMI